MNCLDAAILFNQRCPKGSAAEIVHKSGERLSVRTAGAAFVWGGLALVELEGAKGLFQVEHVRPVSDPSQASTDTDPAVFKQNQRSPNRSKAALPQESALVLVGTTR
ncbi:hypothetical protein GCM10027431_08020 [Lysobacter rhizosphaerae]